MIGDTQIIMSREKVVVMSDDREDGDMPVLSIRSNRTAFSLSHGNKTTEIVVRGQNLPGTVRLTAAVIDAYIINETVFSPGYIKDWKSVWTRTRSEYDLRYNPDHWAAIYVNGESMFSNAPLEDIDALEEAAKGGEITGKVALRAAAKMAGHPGSYAVDHESQMAIVFSVIKSSYKVSILLRQTGETKSFAFKMLRGKDHLKLPTVLNSAANVLESMNLNAFLRRVQAQANSRRATDEPIPPDQIRSAMTRYKELIGFIYAYENAHATEWFPDKPEFLKEAAPEK